MVFFSVFQDNASPSAGTGISSAAAVCINYCFIIRTHGQKNTCFFPRGIGIRLIFCYNLPSFQGDEILTIQKLLNEYGLEIDDIRWYLSDVMTFRLLSHVPTPSDLTKFIWSGQLSDELYNMEERYLTELQDQMDEKTLDESHVRDILKDMEIARRKRHGF